MVAKPKRVIGDQGRIFKVLSKGDQVMGVLRVNFILNLNGMLNKVISCVD